MAGIYSSGQLRIIIANLPNAFFSESRDRLSAGSIKQSVDRFLVGSCEISKSGYNIAAKIGYSCMKRFDHRERYDLLHSLCFF